MKKTVRINKILIFVLILLPMIASAQTTEFTYQGRLLDNNLPPTAVYDFEFRLFGAETGGASLGTVQRLGVSVSNGVFTVRLDFGAQFDGAGRFLEIAVRQAGGGAFTNLAPRQPVTSAPYAMRGSTASNSLLLGGIAPTGFIQNTTMAQTANFNVSGNGTIGGDLNIGGAFNANILNANTQYNLGGSRILSAAGNLNVFAGFNAGTANTTGFANSFFGSGAGAANTTAINNSFFGQAAGFQNTTGQNNTFIGNGAGLNNLTAGSNTFVGNLAGQANTNGSDNSFFGAGAGFSNTAAGNSFFGRNAGNANTVGNFNAFFGFEAGFSNTNGTTNSFFGYQAGRATQVSDNNSFFGFFAGRNNLQTRNSFFGSVAGEENTLGRWNSFFGYASGRFNTVGDRNSFFGNEAGNRNTTGGDNAFFGYFAGMANTTGDNNAFFGSAAGDDNTTGGLNAFFGANSGGANLGGGENSFFGTSSGAANTVGGWNSFFGRSSGGTNTTGIFNTLVGAFADVGANNLSNATAIGARARVSQNNSLVLGSINGVNSATADTNVGIGTTAPQFRLDVQGSPNVLIRTQSSSTIGTWINLTNTSAGGQNWNIISSGAGNDEGAGRLIFFDGTSGLTRMMINGVSGIVTIPGRIELGTLSFAGINFVCRNSSNELSSCSSSLRYKTNVQNFNGGLNVVRRLRPITFNWRDGGAADVGFAAEEVEKIEPLLTTRNDQGEIEGVKYAQITTVLVNAVNEQQKIIEAQQKQIDALKKLVCRQSPAAEICQE